ncbi:phosphotransferase [Streptomyces sp. NPDC001056]
MTVNVDAAPAQKLPRPAVVDLFVHAAGQIHRAAAEIWPGEPVHLVRHVPSVTGYVHRVCVGDRVLYAKTSFLGVSLVSLLRGTHGPWPDICRAQEEYVRRPDSLIAREAEQLQILDRIGRPRVCAVAGLRHGVMFTEPVAGPSLGDLLLKRPCDAWELLAAPFAELRMLHGRGAHRRLAPGRVIGERSISATFLRKFNGLCGTSYVNLLGAERCPAELRAGVVETVRRSVARLRSLRMALPNAEGTTLVYGDLKPEHVLFPDGPEERPVLLDPGLLRASPMVDVAKLISRTVLFLAAHRPGARAAGDIVAGINAFAESRAQGLSAQDRAVWLRNVLTLWLMDTVNILSTYLSAPAALPLPALGETLINRVVPVCFFVDEASAALSSQVMRKDAWELALARAEEVAA